MNQHFFRWDVTALSPVLSVSIYCNINWLNVLQWDGSRKNGYFKALDVHNSDQRVTFGFCGTGIA
jgi:hypothetical protein